jgi:hypothetical protein
MLGHRPHELPHVRRLPEPDSLTCAVFLSLTKLRRHSSLLTPPRRRLHVQKALAVPYT